MCRADPGSCWVLKTQATQKCTQSNNQLHSYLPWDRKGVGTGDRERSLAANRLGTQKWG